PSLEALYSALQEISNELADPKIVHHTRESLIRSAIYILEETCRSRDGMGFDIQKLLIPTESSTLAPAPSVLFNDMGELAPTPQPGLFFAHSFLSPALAQTIGLRKISEEEFARDEDDMDSFHIGEDLTARIQGVLMEYAIDHSSNEWIANADDAKARSFTFLIDEAKFHGKHVIGGLAEFQPEPALVIHNDGVFEEKDFQGLGNIGRGGKTGDTDSIGRFGLGALSFYHFTEFWPRRSPHELSRTVGTAFYKQLISSTEPILLTVEDKPIAPVDAIVHLYHTSPAAVRKVLTVLKVSNYVSSPHFDTSFLDDWGTLRRDSPTEVATILRENAAALQRMWHPIPTPSSKFSSEDVLSILEYLVGDKQPLAGVPLLLRDDGKLAVFQPQDHPSVFASHRGDIADLFGRSAVLSLAVSEVDAQKLAQLGVNVKMLDAEGMRELLRNHNDPITPARQRPTNDRQREWHHQLLTFLARPAAPVKLDDLANLPLLPTVGRDIAISLEYANEDSVWWRSIIEDQSLTTVILQLGIVSVDNLPGELLKMETIDLPRILKLLARFEHELQRLHERVNQADWAKFVRYVKQFIQPNILANHFSSTDFRMLINLPLFEGRQGSNNLPFVSSSQVLMMPSGVSMQDVARYLPNDVIFAMPSMELTAILRRGSDHHRMLSFDNLLGRLQIPAQLPEGTDAEFATLLRLITTYRVEAYHGRLVPDLNRVIRRADQMFDHRVELFSTAYEDRPELFVHHGFRNLIDNLLSLGIQREVTSQRLLECIQAIDNNVRGGLEVGRRATWVWNYVNDAPQPIRGFSFNQIRGLRFIPRHNQRHPSDSNLDHYARELPPIVSLDELCGPERASLVWTQRASFATTPTTLLKAVYAEVGEPTPPDVVQHLVVLATQIGPARAQSPLLFSEVRRVYDWLLSNKDDVSALLQPLSGQPLWLNVNSDQDTWTWRSAEQLVFDLEYDSGQHFDAKNFLTRYRPLLISVGAKEFHYAELRSTTPSSAN
ncbi:hypothetical protein FRC00_008171, partial [Tulasnella sp. 408]